MTPRAGPKIVYGLVDPRDGKVRYVGASSEPGKRYEQHLTQERLTRGPNPWPDPPHRQHHEEHWAWRFWLRELDEAGLRPDLRLLSDPVENWREVERDFQRQYGTQLLNPNDQGPYYQDVRHLVGQHLAAARTAAGLTQSEAAAVLYTTPTTVSRWENGGRSPSLRQLYNIGAAYGVPTSSLLPDLGMPQSEGAKTDATKARRRK